MHSDIKAVLTQLMRGARAILGNDFVGGYLVGSTATGDFDAYSDVDFLIVTRQELSTPQVDALQILHSEVRSMDVIWAEKLEGSYFPRRKLGSHDVTGTNVWYLENGHRTLAPSAHDDTLVVRWVFRERGIAFDGPAPHSLTPPVPIDALKAEVLSTMRAIPRYIVEEPIASPGASSKAEAPTLHFWNRRFGQSFAVLTCCRIMHTLETGRVESKKKAVEWALTAIDPPWTGLIERAWAGRGGDFDSPADPAEYASTLEFYEWAVSESMKSVNSD